VRNVFTPDLLSSVLSSTCYINSSAESDSRNVTKDINYENDNFVSVILGFIVAQGTAVGRETGEALADKTR
jgi:hypothetical protein